MFCVHVVVPMGNFLSHGELASLSPKESQLQQSRATQPILIVKCTLGLFVKKIKTHKRLTCSCFRNPPNSGMDYKDLERAYVIILMRTCTHGERGGGGHTNSEAPHFPLEKTLTHIYCAHDGVRTSALWISNPTPYQLSHSVTPFFNEVRALVVWGVVC